MRAAALSLIGLLVGGPAAAQPTVGEPTGTVQVIARDVTALPIPSAQVELSFADGSRVRATTNERGEARFDTLRPGVYSGHVEAAGFRPLLVEPFQVAAGARLVREVTLQVAGFSEQLEVTPTDADLELMNAFSERLDEGQLAALPEDPEELEVVLRQIFGDDAEIRVNGWTGVRLPVGSRIRDIRIRYDVGAASNGDGPRIDIRATPGGDRWRNTASMSIQDEALSSRNAFSGDRPAGQTRQYSWDLDMPLVRNRTGLSAGVEGSQSIENQVIRAAVPGGVYANLVAQPSSELHLWAGVEHEISATDSVRVDLTRNASTARNRGIGELDLPERAYAAKGSDAEFQIGHRTTLHDRYVNDFRFTVASNSSDTSSIVDVRTIRVLDAFTSGGAQQEGGRRSRTFQVKDDLEFTFRQRHQLTAGLSIDGATYRSDANSNASGTYVFTSLAEFEAGRPATFTQRRGDPTYGYSMYRFAWHLRDDYRVRRDLMLNLGLRHDVQTHLGDWANFSPRIGLNWRPSPKVRTSLQASLRVYHSPLSAEAYGQTLLLNGHRQSDLVITNPGYPDPFSAGVGQAAPPPSVVRIADQLHMPVNRRYSIGVTQPMGPFLRLRGTFSRQVGHQLFRSLDANAPVKGVRPDPSVLAVTQLESTARSVSQSLQTELSVNYLPKRLSARVSYTLGRAMDETDGAFWLPPNSLDVTGEWGTSRTDVRHRVNASVNSDLPGNFRINATLRVQSSSPYTITSGTDPNGDGVFSERPTGVPRNSGRGASTKNLDLTATWRVSRVQRRTEGQAVAGTDTPRAAANGSGPFRFEVFVHATNVLNLINLQNFSGVLTSPFFGLPTSAGPARRIEFGTRAWF